MKEQFFQEPIGVQVITIMVEELMNYAKTCKDVEVFQHVKFEIARIFGRAFVGFRCLLSFNGPWREVQGG